MVMKRIILCGVVLSGCNADISNLSIIEHDTVYSLAAQDVNFSFKAAEQSESVFCGPAQSEFTYDGQFYSGIISGSDLAQIGTYDISCTLNGSIVNVGKIVIIPNDLPFVEDIPVIEVSDNQENLVLENVIKAHNVEGVNAEFRINTYMGGMRLSSGGTSMLGTPRNVACDISYNGTFSVTTVAGTFETPITVITRDVTPGGNDKCCPGSVTDLDNHPDCQVFITPVE